MSTHEAFVLRTLIRERSVAALGTLQKDEPFVSLVPFAVAASCRSLVIHASQLAAHMRNMQRHSQISLLVAESEGAGKMPQSLARVTIQGVAREVPQGDPQYAPLRDVYLRRFPAAAPMFDFADFRLFQIDVTTVRLIAGFAQATTLDIEWFAAALAEAPEA